MGRHRAVYAYVCTLCHHLATSHRMKPDATISGPYACTEDDCECEIMQATPLSGIDVSEYRELFEKFKAQNRVLMLGVDQTHAHEIGACCDHEYRRHLTGLDGCADCEQWEPEHARCTAWRRQLESEPKQ